MRIWWDVSTNTLFLLPSEVYSREDHGNMDNKTGVGSQLCDTKKVATSPLQKPHYNNNFPFTELCWSVCAQPTEHRSYYVAKALSSWVCAGEVATWWWNRGETLGSARGIWASPNPILKWLWSSRHFPGSPFPSKILFIELVVHENCIRYKVIRVCFILFVGPWVVALGSAHCCTLAGITLLSSPINVYLQRFSLSRLHCKHVGAVCILPSN